MFADQALELEGVIGFSGGQKKKRTRTSAASAEAWAPEQTSTKFCAEI